MIHDVAYDNISQLKAWKKFVLDFRSRFDTGNTCDITSLSLLVSALMVSRFHKGRNEQEPIRHKANPQHRLTTKVSRSEAIELDQYLQTQVSRAFPESLSYELRCAAQEFPLEFESVLAEIEKLKLENAPLIIGYTYQYWKDADRKEAQHRIQSADKTIDRDRLIAFTQVYTPDWVVDFILANTILPLLDEKTIELSRLTKWHIPCNDGGNRHTLDEITLIDPACGAGNFLVPAFEALMELKTGQGKSPLEAARDLFARQLFGVDIDKTALSIAAASLASSAFALGLEELPAMKTLAIAEPLDDPLLGSLSDKFENEHPLTMSHLVVVTNPPYIGRKLISRELKSLLKARFPSSCNDLSSAFLARCLELLPPDGRVGLITQSSLMFLPSHAKLRQKLIESYRLVTAVDAGPGVFPLQGGEKVDSAILIVERPALPDSTLTFFFNLELEQDKCSLLQKSVAELRSRSHGSRSVRPVGRQRSANRGDGRSEETPGENESNVVAVESSTFRQFHGYALNYHIPQAVANVMNSCRSLSTQSQIKQGLATTDNERFIKYIWEVNKDEVGSIYFPYAKGVGGQRYFSPIQHVVDWRDDGALIKKAVADRYPYLRGKTEWVVKNESFYFRKGLCFSFVNTRGIAIRVLPSGCVFDVGASAIFSEDDDFFLAYLNSSFIVALANALNPTINYQVGDLKRLPIVNFDAATRDRLRLLGRECFRISAQLSELTDPTSWFASAILKGGVGENGNCLPGENKKDQEDRTDSIGKGVNLDRTYSNYSELVLALQAELSASEAEIDFLVLETLTKNHGWSPETKGRVAHWVERYGVKKSGGHNQKSPQSFVDNAILAELLVALSQPGSSVPEKLNRYRLSFESNETQPISVEFRVPEYFRKLEPISGAEIARFVSKTSIAPFNDNQYKTRLTKRFMGRLPQPLQLFDFTSILI